MPNSVRSKSAQRDPYRELFEQSADAILIIDGETFIDCNEATVKMLRYATRKEMLESHPSELSPPTQPDGRASFEKANEMIAIAFEKGSHRFEWDHRRADGEVFPVDVLLTAVRQGDRKVLHVVWRDITERKRLEEQLRQALKMEAIGKLTGGIAHDFNNLLVAILGHADLLTETLQDRPDALEHVSEICCAGERAADLVRQLLAFGRKQQLLPSVLDLNQLTLDMEKLLKRLLGEDIKFVFKLCAGVVTVKADRSQLEQVLLNLATNARDAMPEGGELRIETRCTRLSRSGLDPDQTLPDGDYAQLTVTDSGMGMDAATLENAFEPFFTTKPPGKGTGLGLATVSGIVNQSGGAVKLRSSPGRGTTVDVFLPRTTEPVPIADAPPERVEVKQSSGDTIVVAEDDPIVAGLVVRALKSRGYAVIPCSDGIEALAAFKEHGEKIRMLVTDVVMPNMGGPKLVSRIEALGLAPRVLFMSGYTNEGLSQRHEAAKNIDIIEKPFNVRELIRRVWTALEQPSA